MENIRRIIPANIKTELDKMNLLDRFLFDETVEDPEVYNAMVEILLEGHASVIRWTETEKEIRVSPQLRQIRLDVISADEDGELYQLEMQRKNTKNLPKRSRYYQAQIDVSLLKPGCIDFNELNDLTTILVAPFDIFGYGLYRYTFEEYCQEVPELKLNDGSRRIFINTKGNNPEEFSQEFLDFMDYINQTTDLIAERSKSNRIRKINDRVRSVKDSEKVGVKLMQAWEERYYDRLEAREQGHAEGHAEGRAEGHAEGRAEGRAEGMREGIRDALRNLVQKKLAKGKSIEEIADILEEPVEVIKELVDELASNEN